VHNYHTQQNKRTNRQTRIDSLLYHLNKDTNRDRHDTKFLTRRVIALFRKRETFERKKRQSKELGMCMKRKTEVLLTSGIVTFFLILFVYVIGVGGITGSTPINFNYSPNPYYTSFTISTMGPSYFFTYASVSISLTNPYAEYIRNFTVYDSLDNFSWILIPISNTSTYTNIGTTPLNGFGVKIYQKIIYQS
jgi:hypothetical protein